MKEFSESFEELKVFIQNKNLVRADKITKGTDVEGDLGITGDDAVEFLEEFSTEFNVDISEFDLSEYFGPEGVDITDVFSRAFRGKPKNQRKVLTLNALTEAIMRGKLS